MIELHAVEKSFGKIRAVDSLTLTIARGEFVVLLGASGSGKSTTLRMINRLVEHDRGTILFQGTDIRMFRPAELRRRMGYAIQSTGLFPHWTVARNVGTVPHLLGWPAGRIAERVDQLLALFGLEPAKFRDRYPHQLSGGQMQRVGAARALAADPEVLLMDEPFSALDPVLREALQAELARIHRATGKTIVLVTHDIDEAIFLASRLVLLDHGRIVAQGTPEQTLGQGASNFLVDFAGRGGLALRRLGMRTVAERVRPGEQACGEALPEAMNLRDALCVFLDRRQDRLPVVDSEGRPMGAIHFADMLRPGAN